MSLAHLVTVANNAQTTPDTSVNVHHAPRCHWRRGPWAARGETLSAEFGTCWLLESKWQISPTHTLPPANSLLPWMASWLNLKHVNKSRRIFCKTRPVTFFTGYELNIQSYLESSSLPPPVSILSWGGSTAIISHIGLSDPVNST